MADFVALRPELVPSDEPGKAAGYDTSDGRELVQVLTELSCGLDEVRKTVDGLLIKVKEGEYVTKNGISYLESKHLLLMSYCQCIVFYILLKAQGKSVQNHPVIARFIETRLFLEKIRPIDKKLHYQIEKLLRLPAGPTGGQNDGHTYQEDALMFKPNPEMLVSKTEENVMGKDQIYRPPMIAPTAMVEEKKLEKRRSDSRAQKEALRRASRSNLIKELASELEGKPEEIKEFIGSESKEMSREISRLEARAQQEENLFARIPLSKAERQKLKHLKRSRNGLMGMIDDFDDDLANLLDIEENKSFGAVLSESSKPQHLIHSSAQTNKLNIKKAFKFKRQGGIGASIPLKQRHDHRSKKRIKHAKQ